MGLNLPAVAGIICICCVHHLVIHSPYLHHTKPYIIFGLNSEYLRSSFANSRTNCEDTPKKLRRNCEENTSLVYPWYIVGIKKNGCDGGN